MGGAQGLLGCWTLAEVTNQSQFFERCVAPLLGDGARRVFVIISDTFRFEAAKHLARDLNAKSRVTANPDALLGVINRLNGTTILITADHGFIYQKSPVDEADRASLSEKPEGTLRAKKRYLFGRNIGQTSRAWCGNTAVTAGTEPGDGSLDFWVPKGASRFHFAGGARFVHGSAMPQEIVLAEFLREMRKRNFADTIDRWFKLGNNLNQRDNIAVRRTVSGLLKLICPAGNYDKEAVRCCLEYALKCNRSPAPASLLFQA